MPLIPETTKKSTAPVYSVKRSPAPGKTPPKVPVVVKPSLPPKKHSGDIKRIGVSATVAADMIGVSERTIWNLATAGTIRYIRVGTRCIFSVRSLDEFVNGKPELATSSDDDDVIQVGK